MAIEEAVRYRVIRAILGLRKDEMAEALGVMPHTLADWENGTRSPNGPSRKKLAELCQKHNIGTRPDGFPVPVSE